MAAADVSSAAQPATLSKASRRCTCMLLRVTAAPPAWQQCRAAFRKGPSRADQLTQCQLQAQLWQC